MDQFNLIVMMKVAKEVTCGKVESSLKEGGRHHNFIYIGRRDVLIFSWLPLEDGSRWEKLALNQLVEVVFIDS
jgi:hypothetical protein